MDIGQAPPLSVVLLAHNENETIERVVREFVTDVVEKNKRSELIVAEDGSTDGTKETLARLSKEYSAVRWVEGEARRGYVNAFKAAMALPENELVVFCDASGKHRASDVFRLLQRLDVADLVVGTKIQRKDPLYRVAMSWIFNRLVNFVFSVKFSDIDCPLRLFRKSAFIDVASIPWREKYLVNYEMVVRFVYSGYRVVEVPVDHFQRASGPSRGLPLSTIPKVVTSVVRTMPLLFLDVRRMRRGRY